MQLFREAVFLLLAFLDLEFTKRKISEYGLQVELNPAIRWLVKHLGIEYGTDIGVVIPTLFIAWLGWYSPCFLSFVLGARFLLFLLQLRSGYAK